MSNDKRLNEVIRVKKQPNSFVMIDRGFLENPELSWRAKGILSYLLSKPDKWKVIARDLVSHAKDGRGAVYNGLNELKEHGYYEKIPVRDERGTFIRWDSVVYEIADMKTLGNTASYPLTKNPEMDNPEMDNPYMENWKRSNNYLSNNDLSNNDIRVRERPPAKNTYGKFNNVRLTQSEHDELMETYGKDKTLYYIDRVDRQIETKSFNSKNHYCTIEEWIIKDKQEKAKSENKVQPARPNRFANFKQREWDEDQLQQLETLYLTEN